jgi:hypothetical protein
MSGAILLLLLYRQDVLVICKYIVLGQCTVHCNSVVTALLFPEIKHEALRISNLLVLWG